MMQLLIREQVYAKEKLRSLFGDPKFEKVVAGDYICEKLGLMHGND